MRKIKKAIFLTNLLVLWVLLAGLNIQKPIVIFDQGHGQKFLIEEKGLLHLSILSGLFRANRFSVRTNEQEISEKILKGVDVLVISGAFIPLTASEIDSIVHFVERGGKLCVMLHIGQPVGELLWKFNVLVSNGIILEDENLINDKQKDFYITRFESHPLMDGLKKFAIHGGWALYVTEKHGRVKYGKVIAKTSPKAWIDLNRDGNFNNTDAKQSFGVVVAGRFGKGSFVIFGDDAIFQNIFLQKYNMSLGNNLVKWLSR